MVFCSSHHRAFSSGIKGLIWDVVNIKHACLTLPCITFIQKSILRTRTTEWTPIQKHIQRKTYNTGPRVLNFCVPWTLLSLVKPTDPFSKKFISMHKLEMVKLIEVNKQFLSLWTINYFVAYTYHWIKANKFQLEVSNNKYVFFF